MLPAWLALSTCLHAQENLPVVNFQNVQYKAQHQNWAISQSEDGILYAGNSDGLLEFDGAQWRLYPLPDNQITRTVFCSGSRIFVGGYGEFGYWQKMDTGDLHYHSLSRNSGIESTQTEEIWHILKIADYLYFQSFSYIYRYDLSQEAQPPVVTEIRAPGNFMFLQPVHDRILVQLIEKGLYEMKDDRFIPLPGTEALARTSVCGLLPYGTDGVLIATVKDGLYQWENGVMSPWRLTESDHLKKNLLNKAVLLTNGDYALGTLLAGVSIISPDGVLRHRFDKQNGLQNNSVLGMYEDMHHNLWLALDKGIDLLSLSSPLSFYNNQQVPLETTYAVAYWDNQLYVGSNLGLFRKKWPSSDPFRLVPGLAGQVWELKTFDGQLLCGHSEGTFLVTANGVKKIGMLPGGWATVPLESPAGPLLLQGTYTGLCVYRKDKAGEWTFSHKVADTPTLPIKYIALSENGTLWMAHAYKGLYRAQLNADATAATGWTDLSALSLLPDLNNAEVVNWNGRISIRSGGLFFTPSGDNRLLPDTSLNNSQETPFKIRQGIGNEWFKIYQDHIVLQNSQAVPIRLELVRNYETVAATPDYYFFCMNNGYAVYNRHSKTSPPYAIRAVIRRVSSLREPSLLLPAVSPAAASPRIRDLRIQFALPLFEEKVHFRYRLKGFTDKWSEWSEQTQADFTNLRAGNYTFELQNSYNRQLHYYHIELQPRWHETGWAHLTALLTVVLLIVYLVYLQERRMQKQRLRLLNEHEEQLHQRELANEKRIMEIRNEQLTTAIRSKSQQLSNIAINVVRKNEILEEIKSELIQVKQDLGQQFPAFHYQKLLESITRNVSGKEDWKVFEDNFNEVHEKFFARLKHLHPEISPSELKLAAALRMNLSSKEIAPIMSISIRGVEIKRYRLRKKLNLPENTNLNEYMMAI